MHDESDQAFIAAFHEKDAENNGEENALIIWTSPTSIAFNI
jgi:hypothetical protein